MIFLKIFGSKTEFPFFILSLFRLLVWIILSGGRRIIHCDSFTWLVVVIISKIIVNKLRLGFWVERKPGENTGNNP